MINKKEILIISISILTLAVASILMVSSAAFLYVLVAVFFVVGLNLLAKKIASHYLDSEIKIKLWEVERYGFKAHQHFKKPFPMGIFLPLFTSAITFGQFIWMSPLTFEIRSKTYRAAKRHGLYSFTEMTENHIGLIAAAGIATNLFFAFLGYLINIPIFSKINIYYAFFNMIPLSNLDGNKIFFGNNVLWSFLAAITLVAVGYLFLMV